MKRFDQEVSCPSCSWQPDGVKHWKCNCGHIWDIFSTAGRCPACFYQWEKTKCPPRETGGCNTYSPHIKWYGNLDAWLARELEFLNPVRKKIEKQRRGSRGL